MLKEGGLGPMYNLLQFPKIGLVVSHSHFTLALNLTAYPYQLTPYRRNSTIIPVLPAATRPYKLEFRQVTGNA